MTGLLFVAVVTLTVTFLTGGVVALAWGNRG